MQHVRDNRQSRLFVLIGPSGVGKSTILRYMERRFGAESAPKYTTRPSRDTEGDARDFIFCKADELPVAGVLRFESYGHLFGIQLDEIDRSLERGRSHVTIVGDCGVVTRLSSTYKGNLVAVFVFCDASVLRTRMLSDPSSQRAKRWPQVCDEIATIYSQLGCVEFVINNSGSRAATFLQVDRLWYCTKAMPINREVEGV